MRRAAFVFAGFLATAQPVFSGPWARDPGAVFLSYSLNLDSEFEEFDLTPYHSIYGEFGLGRRLTLGADIGGDEATSQGSGFLRYTLTRNAAVWQFAGDIGVGWRAVDGAETAQMLRVGASVGRGFGRDRFDWVPWVDPEGGWFSVDAYTLLDPDGDQTLWQAEATLGIVLSARTGAMVQAKVEEYPDAEMAAFISPSLLVYFGEDTTLRLGGRVSVAGTQEAGLQIGLWREF
ncbi:MAG: hypothetical protein AAGA70_07390 [Pseudomonadota bacterium]